jgi:hypothetical protein
MNAVEDNIHLKNKNMNTINEQRWMKLAGLLTENEVNGNANMNAKIQQYRDYVKSQGINNLRDFLIYALGTWVYSGFDFKPFSDDELIVKDIEFIEGESGEEWSVNSYDMEDIINSYKEYKSQN